MKKLDRANSEIVRLNDLLKKLQDEHEKLKIKLEDAKEDFAETKDTLDRTLVADQRLKFEVQYLTGDIAAMKKSKAESVAELDKLYTENDNLKDKINVFNT